MARVLFLTQVLPYPLDAGPKTRAHYVLRYLAQRHEVTLVSFVRPDDREDCIAHLEGMCHRVHTVPMTRSFVGNARAAALAATRRLPVIIVRDEIAAMQGTLRHLIEQAAYDVIHADQTSMAQYALYCRAEALRARPSGRVKIVMDAHNALYRVFSQLEAQERGPLKRLFLAREARSLEHYEHTIWSEFDHLAFVADADRLLAERGGPAQGRATTIPICIDPADKQPVEPRDDARLITHLGTMFWPPNVDGVLWFARQVLPLVLERVPEARLVVIGKNPPPEVRRLAQHPGIEVLGYVADPLPYLAKTAAFIVPLRAGAGMRVKILDGWCWGLPIVTTSLGAEGIECHDGATLLIADEPAAYAGAVARLLQDAELRRTLGGSGRQWVSERYDWRVAYAEWGRIYEGLLRGRPT